MRARALFAIAILLLPSAVSAQRIPIPTRRGPSRPTPLPPQPPTIVRELSYTRLPYSVETYPLVTRFVSPGFTGGAGPSSWTSGGAGTIADFKVTRQVSLTLDMGASFLGGPMMTQSAEVGTRVRPAYSERRLYPFVDARVGYMHAQHKVFTPYYQPFSQQFGDDFAYVGRYSQGIGAIAGGGFDYAVSTRFFLMAGAAVARHHMWVRGFDYQTPERNNFDMTSYRFMVGVRFNPVRVLAPPGPMGQ